MSKHLFGLVVTPHGTAANNRGETPGNITTLQKILWNGEVHTTVSAEALRWSIRWYWQRKYGKEKLNRQWIDEEFKPHHEWQDLDFQKWKEFLDDDVLGFMNAEAARNETNESEEEGEKKKKKKGTAKVRRSRLEVTRAISLSPFAGDITFNAAGIKATPSASRTGEDPVPYGTEVHATRYQYGFALTPDELSDKKRALDVIDAIISLSEVAGNHARFLYDFSPESIIFRWTDDFAPRILYGFSLNKEGQLTIPEVIRRIESGDVNAGEIIIGGPIAELPEIRNLKGVSFYTGVKAAATDIKNKMSQDLGIR